MEESDLTKTVFGKFVKRPVFLNGQLDGVGNQFNPFLLLQNLTMTEQDREVEVVGSTTDGLQVARFSISGTLMFSSFPHTSNLTTTMNQNFGIYPRILAFYRSLEQISSKKFQKM